MKIQPTVVAQKEFMNLLVDEGNYARKITELNKLLVEINKKTTIANTLKDAEKMKFQAEANLLEAQAFKRSILSEEEKLKKVHKVKLDGLRRRESAITHNETEFLAKKKALEADVISFVASSESFSRSVAAFDAKKKKSFSELVVQRGAMDATMEKMLKVHRQAMKDLTEV